MGAEKFLRSFVAALTALAIFAFGAAEAKSPEIFMDEGGVFSKAWDYALDGYDAVAYFDLEKDAPPVAGLDEYSTEYKGVKWRFSSEENLQKFVADPDAYRPQYGGYCAWAMARDKLAKGDPEVWYVYEGKLYLNISKSIQRKWLSDIDDEIKRADANWPGVLDEN